MEYTIYLHDIINKYTDSMPSRNTVKVLEDRRKYLIEKLNKNLHEYAELGVARYSYLVKEIRALERTIRFLKWLIKNAEDDTVKNIVEKYKGEQG